MPIEVAKSKDHHVRAGTFCNGLKLFESKYNSANPQSCIQIVTRDALEGKKSGNAFLREVIRKHMPDIHLAAPEDAIVRSDDYSVIGVILNSYDRDTIKNGLLTTADLMNQLNGMHDPEFSHIPN